MSLTTDLDAARPAKQKLGQLADLLERSGIPIEEIGRVDRINVWQGFYKDEYGEAQTVDMHSIQVQPIWSDGPEWPVVQQAKPVNVKPSKLNTIPDDGVRRAVVLPDPQIGFRRFDDGTLDPFHDEQAMDIGLQIIKTVRPHEIVNLGDTMDFPEFGTYEQEPAFALTTQATIDRAHSFLGEQKAHAGPELERISLLEGNHDRRLEKSIRKNAMAAFGLKRANEPESWPVMSVPHLLRLDDLDVNYVGGYPAGVLWLDDHIACIHGSKVRSQGSTAAAVVSDEHVNVLFGHVHRIELQHRTRRDRNGPVRSFAATPGCLSRTDGAVPSVKSSTDAMGRPLVSHEDWQQGIGVLSWVPGSGEVDLELVHIRNGAARFRGKLFESRVKEA